MTPTTCPPPLKLLIFIVDLAGGTGTFTRNLAKGLTRDFGHEIQTSLLTMRPWELTPEERTYFHEVHSVGAAVRTGPARLYETPLDALRVRRAMRRLDFDLVFTVATYSNLIASVAAGPSRIVMSEHLNMTLRLRSAPGAGFIRRLMRWRYPKSLVVAAARGITRDLEEHFGANRTEVIPNGLDVDVVRARATADGSTPLPLPDQPFNVAVGRLAPQKDYPTLIRAHALARQQGLREHLVIVGDGDLRPELQDLARSLGADDSIHFLGHQPNPYPIMHRARAHVLSSVFEGFAYSPIEAMALGLPCIATDCPSGPGEILGGGEFGLLVPPSDPPALAGALTQMADPARRDFYIARSHIRAEQLSIGPMAKAYRDIFLRERTTIH